MGDRVTVTASCGHCTYRLQVTDDTVMAVMAIIRSLLRQHLDEAHAPNTPLQIRDVLLMRLPDV